MTSKASLLSDYLQSTGVQLCCGVDPDPYELRAAGFDDTQPECVREWIDLLLGVAIEHTKVFKLQKAFFDLLPEGRSLLAHTIACIHDVGAFAILDAKVGDTSNTMKAYWRFANSLDADFLTITPYFGPELWESQFGGDCLPAVITRSSNLGAASFQDLQIYDGRYVWEMVLDNIVNSKCQDMLVVFSSRSNRDIRRFAATLDGRFPVLFGGFGHQGVQAKDVNRVFSAGHYPLPIFNSSRALTFPHHDGVYSESYVSALEQSFAQAMQLTKEGGVTR